jgi:hypothetical protein
VYADHIDYALRRQNFGTSLHAIKTGIVQMIALCLIRTYGIIICSSVSQEGAASIIRIAKLSRCSLIKSP